jgi:hypothetical protein
MGLFRRAPKWEQIYRIDGSTGGIRLLMGALFWIWGLGGFALVLTDLSELFGKLREGVGVGSSSFLAAIGVVWIGGMVFFGLGALIASANFNMMQRVQDDDYGDVRVGR